MSNREMDPNDHGYDHDQEYGEDLADEPVFEPDSPEPPSEDEDMAPSRRRGCGWTVLLALLGVIVLAVAGAWALRLALDRGTIAPFDTTFNEVSLLPAQRIQTAEPEMEIKVYFIAQGQALQAESYKLPKPAGSVERAHLIARQLATPPASGSLASPLPEGVTIRGLYVLNGIVWVDLSKEFLSAPNPSPLGERLAVYGLVDSFLLNDPSLSAVRILIDGRQVTTAWGWLDLSTPLSPDLSLVQ